MAVRVRVMLEGVRVQDRPLDGEDEELRFTVPVKAFNDWTVIVDDADAPALALTLVGLAETEKSGTAMLYVTVEECERGLLVPVMVTV